MLLNLTHEEAISVAEILDKGTFRPNIELSERDKKVRKVMRRIKQRVKYEDQCRKVSTHQVLQDSK